MARRRGPPQQGDPVTLAITDIHGSTTLWDMFPEEKSKDILRHHEAARGRLKEFQGYEVGWLAGRCATQRCRRGLLKRLFGCLNRLQRRGTASFVHFIPQKMPFAGALASR